MRPNNESNFWKKVDKSNVDGCWIWKNAKDKDGYGLFSFKNKQFRSHRFVAEFIMKLGIRGLMVCHKCDNPPCVNPAHLFVGTNSDNIRDMVAKSRGLIGRKRSAESIAKSSAGRRGKKWTQEMRDRASKIQKGRKATEQAKLNMSLAQRGRKHSEATKLKIGMKHIGMKRSERAKSNMKIAQARRRAKGN